MIADKDDSLWEVVMQYKWTLRYTAVIATMGVVLQFMEIAGWVK